MQCEQMLLGSKPTSRTRSSVKAELLTIAVLTVLAAFSFAQEPNTNLSMQVTLDSEHRSVVTFRTTYSDEQGDLLASFFFNSPKGFLGPSKSPSDQNGFNNTEKTLFGVNYQPATKSSFVYLFSKTKAADLLYLRNINPRVALLLSKPWSDTASSFLRIESIVGRRVNLQTVDFSKNSRPSFEFSLYVSSEGLIRLSK
jgi:hypothetical protein